MLLARLAHRMITTEPAPDPRAVSAVLAAASQLAGEALAAAWNAYLDAVSAELAIEDGVLDWRDIDDTITCCERTETAREIARERSADALAVLTGRQP